MAIYYGDGTNSSSGRQVQVIETRINGGFTTQSTTYVDVTNLNASITLSSSANKVLVEAPVWTSMSHIDSYSYVALYRGTSVLQESGNMPADENSYNNQGKWVGINYLDTPGSGTHTYKVALKSESASKTAKLSIGGNNNNHDGDKPDMVLRLTEIAAT